MKEYLKEEVYPILHIKDLYLPKHAIKSRNSPVFNRLKLSLNDDVEKSFNDLRCENLDFVATYRPYHFNGGDFGLYVYAESFCVFLLSVLRHMDFREAHTLALDAALTHGSFHYLLERYALLTQNYLPAQESLYIQYKKNSYSKNWGTSKCYEEILSNVFIFLCMPKPKENLTDYENNYKSQIYLLKKQHLNHLMVRQREGYCHALDVDFMNVHKVFTNLEMQLGIDRAKLKHPKEKALPSLYKYVEGCIPFRYLGLPVYLVNDCKKESDFDRIIDVIFTEI